MASPQKKHTAAQLRRIAASVAEQLQKAGHTAYFAGGCVRDELLGLEPTDYDVATDAKPETIAKLFRSTAAVGASFGVMLVHEQGVCIEVATFRSDGPYSDNRRPDSIRYTDAKHDAQRRDFTINALFLDPIAAADAPSMHGHVIDFVGGRDDLAAGLVRAVGVADDRLAEDHLRALRAVRFAARFGFAIEAGTEDAIREHTHDLAGVSSERIGDELRRMLTHRSRARAIGLIEELGLDSVVLGATTKAPTRSGTALAHFADEHTLAGCLAAWAFDRNEIESAAQVPALVQRWRQSLCLSNEERKRFRDILLGVLTTEQTWNRSSVAQKKRHAWSDWFDEALGIVAARGGKAGGTRAAAVRKDVVGLASDGIGLAPEPLLDGNDLIELGLAPGPGFARTLAHLYDAQLEGRVRSRSEAEKFVLELKGNERV